jgi:hypothetical protein
LRFLGFKIEGFEIRDLGDLGFGTIGGNRVEAHLLFQHFVCGVFWRQRIECASEDERASEREREERERERESARERERGGGGRERAREREGEGEGEKERERESKRRQRGREKDLIPELEGSAIFCAIDYDGAANIEVWHQRP